MRSPLAILELGPQDPLLRVQGKACDLLVSIACPGATSYQLDDEGIRQIAFEETEHFPVTRAFLNHRERMRSELFSAE